MTAAQVPEPTAEHYAVARQIVVGLRSLTGKPLRSDSFDVAAEVARAIAAAAATEQANSRQAEHDAYLRGLSEGLGRMASVVNDAVRRLNASKPREKANDERHADRHRTVGNTTFCAVRGCGWSAT